MPLASVNDLGFLLKPMSIAVLGASTDLTKINGRTVRYLLEKRYAGAIYPVNPKHERIAGLKCYPSIAALPEAVDLAVVALPAREIPRALLDLGRRGVRSAVVFSSGFAEAGEAGRRLELEAVNAARAGGVRLCGPNCLGLINAFDRVMATFGQFAEAETPPGPVAFVTQSGAFGTAIAALARRRGMGLGYFINTGNEADIGFADAMRSALQDDRITVGAGYIEGLKDGRGLLKIAERALESGKPLVLAKVGRSAAGARAAVSHTGALAGADEVFDGVIRNRGIVRARNEEQMLDIVEVFSACRTPEGKGLGIITQSGGAGVLIADRAEEMGLSVPVLTPRTREALARVLPGFSATGNPVDVTGQFIAEPQLLSEAANLVLLDPQIHLGIVWLQLMDAYVDTLVAVFEQLKAKATKPFVVCWVAAPEKALAALRARGIAVLRGAEPAVDAAAALVRYAEMRRNWLSERTGRPAPEFRTASPLLEMVNHLPSGSVSSVAAGKYLAQLGIPMAGARLARSAEEAAAAAAELGYPVALKAESPDVPHKSEVRGVKLGLPDADAVRRGFAEIIANVARHRPAARIEGLIVQQMARGEVELVVGLKRDPVFGMVVMAGLGGFHVEVLKDVVFRAAPVTADEADRMLNELRAAAVLDGVRGRPPVDRRALTEIISAVSLFGAAAGARLVELELNPVVAGPEGAMAVDWLLVLE